MLGPEEIFYMIHIVPLDRSFMLSAAPLQGPGGPIPYCTISTEDLTGALLSISDPPKDIAGLMSDITDGKAVSVLAFLGEGDLRKLGLAS